MKKKKKKCSLLELKKGGGDDKQWQGIKRRGGGLGLVLAWDSSLDSSMGNLVLPPVLIIGANFGVGFGPNYKSKFQLLSFFSYDTPTYIQ